MRARISLLLLLGTCAFAQNPTYFGAVGWCHLGGQGTVTQGLQSSGTQPLSGSPFSKGSGVDASYPKCTITVFPTGQTSPAQVFSTSAGAVLSNPFTANVDGSFQFFVLPGCYDITESSGITTGSTMPTSHTDSDLCFGSSAATTAACPTNNLGALAYASGAGVLLCDNSLTTDTHGNATGQSFTAVAPWNGDDTVTSTGTQSPFALAAHTWAWTAPNVLTTPMRNVVPSTACGVAQTLQVVSQTTDPTNTLNVNWGCANFSSGVSITATVPIVVTPSPLTGTGVISCPTCSTGSPIRGLAFTIYNPSGLASGVSTASVSYLTIPYSCTIAAYNLAIDAGTITVKFWKVATGTAIPTSGNSISTSGVSISSGTAIHSTTLTDFTTTTVTANDIMAMDITAVTSATFVNGVLQCQ